MKCAKCTTNPVINLTGNKVKLCKNHFIKYFEKKVVNTIDKYRLINRDEAVAVAVSGGKDSITLLSILDKLKKKKGFSLIAIAVDEGIEGYRNLKNLEEYCKEKKIYLETHSFEKEFGFTLDKALKKVNVKACTICGILRRYLLNKKARLLKVDKLATGHNLDDEAQSVLMNQFRGNISQSARLGPSTGTVMHKNFIPRIKPLYFLTEKEVATYCFIKKFPVKFSECFNANDSYRAEIRDLLNNFEVKHPGSKHSVISSFLEMLPYLKEKFSNKEIKICNECNEPCSGNVCKACEMLEKLKKV